jgi:hypothetical protein
MKALFTILALVAAGAARAYTTLPEAYAALGFDPTAPGNHVIVHFSDPHLHLDPGDGYVVATNLYFKLVNAINAMDPRPGKILVSGDICSSYSSVPGSAWSERAAYYGSNELACWYPALAALTNVPVEDVRWVPGNHDQLATETNAEFFCAQLGRPPHEVLDFAGIRFFLFNGGNCSEPSESEKRWLRQQVAATAPTQTVAVMVHQPAFSAIAAERGTALLLREVFGNWPSPWWLLSGHAHYQELSARLVGNSEVVATVSGTVNTNAFCGQDPVAGFRIFCLSNGVAGTIYYHYTTDDYEVERPPDWEHSIPYVAAFETVDGLLWRRFKTPAHAPEAVYEWTYGSLYWYAYPMDLQWEMPLHTFANRATHFLILSGGLRGTVSFSTDRTNWINAPDVVPTNQVYAFPIPAEVAVAPTGYARFWQPTLDNFVGGWGLSTTNPGPQLTYPLLAPPSDLETAPGRGVVLQLVADDPFAPPDVLHFELVSGPSGASLDAQTGVFAWTPGPSDGAQERHVVVKVHDDGTPAMSATRSFTIRVAPMSPPQLGRPVWAGASCAFDVTGLTGVAYTVQVSTDLLTWETLAVTNPVASPFRIVDTGAASLPHRFYRCVAGP